MGVMDLSLIRGVHVLILFSRETRLILDVGVENRQVGSFGKLGRVRRMNQQFANVPLVAFNFMINLNLGSIIFCNFLARILRLPSALGDSPKVLLDSPFLLP